MGRRHRWQEGGQPCRVHQATLGLHQEEQPPRSREQPILQPRQEDGQDLRQRPHPCFRYGQIPFCPLVLNHHKPFWIGQGAFAPSWGSFSRFEDHQLRLTKLTIPKYLILRPLHLKKNGAPRELRDPKVPLGNLAKPDTFYPFSIYYFENSFISINLRRFLPRSLLKRRHFLRF